MAWSLLLPPYPETASNSIAFWTHMGERARDNTIFALPCMHVCMYVSWDLEREDDCLLYLARRRIFWGTDLM
jgi:hypothetical protein